ncbi:hypothetical protein, partial [Mycobacterium tuberculosis]|uniref:hypothetical protein n=1 Tax=Mycobacterium tuberculosis TaxID=1773 RepID=UPI002549CA03
FPAAADGAWACTLEHAEVAGVVSFLGATTTCWPGWCGPELSGVSVHHQDGSRRRRGCQLAAGPTRLAAPFGAVESVADGVRVLDGARCARR